MVKHQDRSLIQLAAAIIIIYCTYQFLLTPDLKQSVNQVLSNPKSVATVIATMLPQPTTVVKVPTTPPRQSVAAVAPIARPTAISLCSLTSDQSHCIPDPTPIVPTQIPPTEQTRNLYECYPGSFYNCEDLAEMGDTKAIDAVQATDEFLIVPTTAPAVRQEYIDACNAKPKGTRGGFLEPICIGAGL